MSRLTLALSARGERRIFKGLCQIAAELTDQFAESRDGAGYAVLQRRALVRETAAAGLQNLLAARRENAPARDQHSTTADVDVELLDGDVDFSRDVILLPGRKANLIRRQDE